MFDVATPVNEAIQRAANELAGKRRTLPFTPDELRARVDILARKR
jgi:hypothetical protein